MSGNYNKRSFIFNQFNEDVYHAISYTVKLIDDGHGILLDAKPLNRTTNSELTNPEYTPLKSDNRFINWTLSASALSCWIVDLRENKCGLR